MKKIISILLVVLTVFSLAVTMASAEETTGTFVVEFYDDNGTTLKDTITVYYGEDFNAKAPNFDSYSATMSDGTKQKFVHEGWMIMNYNTYAGRYIPKGNLPKLGATDKVPAVLKIKAQYKNYEDNLQNNVQDSLGNIVDSIPGGSETFTSISDFFSSFVSLIRNWFMQVALFLNAFM